MVNILPRSAWTTARNGRAGRPMSASRMFGVAIHYPAAGNVTYRGRTREQVAALLRGWRSFHVNTRGWADIGYNFAIDGQGRIWDLTGFNIGAHAGAIGNPTRVGVLFIVGNNEQPSAAMLAAFRDLRAHVVARYPKATAVEGHQQVPGNATACPGAPIMALIRSGELTKPPTPDAPATRGRRIDRALEGLKAEIQRLKKARDAAKRNGREVRRKRIVRAIRRTRRARKALKKINKK